LSPTPVLKVESSLAKTMESLPETTSAKLDLERRNFSQKHQANKQELESRIRDQVHTEMRNWSTLIRPTIDLQKRLDYTQYALADSKPGWPLLACLQKPLLTVTKLAVKPGVSHNGVDHCNPTQPHCIEVANHPGSYLEIPDRTKLDEEPGSKKFRAAFNRQIKSVVRDLHQYRLQFGQVRRCLPS
jgi:hypothetical protein